MQDRPEWGTAPICCARTKCKWRGYEADLKEAPVRGGTQSVCPVCEHDSYMFMTPGEIKFWERCKNESRTEVAV